MKITLFGAVSIGLVIILAILVFQYLNQKKNAGLDASKN